MDYEEKYKQALDRAKERYSACSAPALLEYIFPELNESEDEKIRKAIICGMNTLKNNQKKKTFADIPLDDCIDWLEKQDKWRTEDKLEPKFNEGDWIIFNGLTLYVKEVVNGFYRTISKGGIINSYDWDIDNIARLWTIQDAKDGDVLSGEIDGDKYIFSFKKLNGRWIETRGVCYCETTGECIEDARFCNHYQDFFKPASKEECDVLLLKTVNHQLK